MYNTSGHSLGPPMTMDQQNSFTPILGPSTTYPAAAADAMANMYNQAAMATYAAYSPYMQPQMLAAAAAAGMQPYTFTYAPTSQMPMFSLPEANGASNNNFTVGNALQSNGGPNADNGLSSMMPTISLASNLSSASNLPMSTDGNSEK